MDTVVCDSYNLLTVGGDGGESVFKYWVTSGSDLLLSWEAGEV